MSSIIPLLSNVKVAAPCPASWQDMETVDGDRVHYCGGCKKNVYNLSAMSQGQAEGLLRKHEGHLCVRYYKRTDGTILTQNCPVGQAALRMKMIARSKQAALAAAAVTAIVALGDMRFASQNQAIMGDAVMPPTVFEQVVRSIENDREVMGAPIIKFVPPHDEIIGKATMTAPVLKYRRARRKDRGAI